eukprot:4814653-Prymnesium_polylepis.1
MRPPATPRETRRARSRPPRTPMTTCSSSDNPVHAGVLGSSPPPLEQRRRLQGPPGDAAASLAGAVQLPASIRAPLMLA